MNITFVLAVYNKLDLTKECYRRLRKLYPSTPLIISSGGSTDGTESWLKSLEDVNLKFVHSYKRISFSETYNEGILRVETDKLVLIHNDMVIGEKFLENIESLLTEDMILSYTTIEPPIFAGHRRPGKVILDFGSSFENFDEKSFNLYVKENYNKNELYDGAVFFMSGYKETFLDIGLFDGNTFYPCFCEDDDFLIRAKLKGYKLKTTENAITYHFVSQTSRFSDEMVNQKQEIEYNSNRNFIRKWGCPIYIFHQLEYQKIDNFKYEKKSIGLVCNNNNVNLLQNVEPFFDKIKIDSSLWNQYVIQEKNKTRFDLKNKINDVFGCDVIVEIFEEFNSNDFDMLLKIQFVVSNYGSGIYGLGNMKVNIK